MQYCSLEGTPSRKYAAKLTTNDTWDRYWDNPEVLQKLGEAMGDAFNPEDEAAGGAAPGERAEVGEEEDEDGSEELATVSTAASSGEITPDYTNSYLRCCHLSRSLKKLGMAALKL